MGLNDTVSAERIHISFFGMRNAGKSSLVNAVTGQDLSVVSDIKGTTTDPVKKAMELLPLGPVLITDTPGLDDEGELGGLRIKKSLETLSRTDIAVVVLDCETGISQKDAELIAALNEKNIPYVTAYNKSDLIISNRKDLKENEIYTSAKTGEGIELLKNFLAGFAKKLKSAEKFPVRDLLKRGDIVVLVTPIDESAPKGRLILPQQMILRDILDAHASAFVCQESELSETLSALSSDPTLVITDSQVFGKVAQKVPENVPLTSFSILMARYKGDLAELVRGAAALKKLKNGSRVLISEGCTHHRQCNDIGTVKIPGWIKAYTNVSPEFSFTSGGEFPEKLSDYELIVHCGGCMLNEAEMKNRVAKAVNANVPIVNYGIAIAEMHGILRRSLEPFPEILALLNN